MIKINLLFFRSFCVFITLLLTSTLVFAQKNVSGRVTDASGSGVAGITVTVKGSNNATQTSNDGTYSVLVPQGANTVSYTHLDVYKRQQEYRMDGFRFDLSKGFTQKQTCDNSGGNCNVCLLYTSRCV